jgi:hypothetical protein
MAGEAANGRETLDPAHPQYIDEWLGGGLQKKSNMGFLPQYFYNYERLARSEGEDVEEVKRLDRRKSWTVAIMLFLFALFGVVRIGRK